MANHCSTKTATALTGDERSTRFVAAGSGEVIRYRLEATEVEWQIAPGRTVRGYGFSPDSRGDAPTAAMTGHQRHGVAS